jgi:hypothetical protein
MVLTGWMVNVVRAVNVVRLDRLGLQVHKAGLVLLGRLGLLEESNTQVNQRLSSVVG